MTLQLNDLSPLVHLVTGEVGKVGQDYVEGKVDLDGGMRELMAAAAELMPGDPTEPTVTPPAPLAWVRQAALMARSRARHRPETDAEQIQFHYDVSDDFYALWLDPRRVYSCAYYREAGMSIAAGAGGQARAHLPQADAEARRALPRHRRRLGRPAAVRGRALRRARPGHHAQQEPARARQQADRRARAAGRVRMHLLDYRRLDESEPYDKIASVGMFEHVGRAPAAGVLRQDPPPARSRAACCSTTASPPAARATTSSAPASATSSSATSFRAASSSTCRTCSRRRPSGPRGRRRREPAAALREDALGVERRARGAARHRARADHRHASCAPTGSTSPAARCASSAAWLSLHQMLCARPHRRRRDGPMRGAQSGFPFNRAYMYPQR